MCICTCKNTIKTYVPIHGKQIELPSFFEGKALQDMNTPQGYKKAISDSLSMRWNLPALKDQEIVHIKFLNGIFLGKIESNGAWVHLFQDDKLYMGCYPMAYFEEIKEDNADRRI